MKIVIRENDGKIRRIYVPNTVFCNRIAANVIVKHLNKQANGQGPVTASQLYHLMMEIKQCAKREKNWTIVDVKSANGEAVQIMM